MIGRRVEYGRGDGLGRRRLRALRGILAQAGEEYQPRNYNRKAGQEDNKNALSLRLVHFLPQPPE